MKKIIAFALALVLIFSLCACGSSASNSNQSSSQQAPTQQAPTQQATKTEPTPEPTPEPAPEPSDTVSANGYTIKIIGVHKTADSNGDPMVAVEYEYTNANAQPMAFMWVGQTKVFQGGIECSKDEMFLERDFDWDTQYLEIKDGATINVFVAKPLRNADDPIEVVLEMWDMTSGKMLGSASMKFDLSE